MFEDSTIEKCIQGMQWGLQYVLHVIWQKTLEELTTKTRDIKLSMSASGVERPPVQESQDKTYVKNSIEECITDMHHLIGQRQLTLKDKRHK